MVLLTLEPARWIPESCRNISSCDNPSHNVEFDLTIWISYMVIHVFFHLPNIVAVCTRGSSRKRSLREDHRPCDFCTFLLAAEKLDKRERKRECGT